MTCHSLYSLATGIFQQPIGRMAAGRFRQLGLLLWKNWLFSIRSWKATVLQLLAPCFFLILVTALAYLPQGLKDDHNPEVTRISTLPKCEGWNGKECTSLIVMALNFQNLDPSDWNPSEEMVECVQSIAGTLVNESNLEGDVKYYLNSLAVFGLLYPENYFIEHNNQTQVAVFFSECSLYEPPKLNYTILYNSSRSLRFQQLIFGSPNKPDGRTELAIMLDRIFISKVTNRSVDISVDAATFPVIYQQESVESKQTTSATTFLFCAITFQFVMMMYNVVSEKDLKLRQGLKLIGLKDSIYWISWSITGLVIAFLSTVILMVSGYACQLKFFLNTEFMINFLLFFIYSSSMVPLAFFFSVFISTVRQAVNMGMLIFVVGLMILSLLSNPFILTQTYEYVPALVVVLSFLPPFHLAKVMADIGIAASDTDINGLPQQPYFFSWHYMAVSRKVLMFGSGSSDPDSPKYFEMPPTYQSYIYLVLNALFYGILAWYLDAVWRGNHGIPRKWYFFAEPSYWFDWLPYWTKKTERLTAHLHETEGGSEEEVGEGAALLGQRQNHYDTLNECYALRIDELKKTFYSGVCCCKSPNQCPAVDGLSLNVQEHHILALLGHNGAGKSTTINMLTGLLEADGGDAYFYGLSVRKNLDAIRSILGVCPQHDVLWGDLTAREHMQLFGNLKNIPKHKMVAEIKTLLEEVQLNHVADHRVSTFSGGMKRRLSVALSFLGDPKIMFLDEPTTGMDPRIRRDIWNLILRMKQDRVTIMTTHSMEEADILGDTIAILANGQLKVMGTSVNLKNRFAGYNIELVARQENVREIMDFVASKLPGATPKSEPIDVEGGGALLPFNLPPERNGEIIPFFKVIEGDDHISSMILDYSISQTTLEEVFLNVTLSEYFKDQEYQPVLMRSGSYTSPTQDVKKTLADSL